MAIQAILFDLDNTLYPASSGLMEHMSGRISGWVQQALQLDADAAHVLCKHYYATYGATVHGLRTYHPAVDPHAYLEYVHDIAIEQFLGPSTQLHTLLGRLPVRKIIFTNSVQPYAERVLACLGIREHFEQIFDLHYFDFDAKPNPAAYQHVLERLGLDGAQTIMVEDTLANLVPAKAFGMHTILIDETLQATVGADYIVPDVVRALEVAQELIDVPLKVQRPTRSEARLRKAA